MVYDRVTNWNSPVQHTVLYYINKGLKPVGDILITLQLQTGFVTAGQVEKAIIQPCIDDAINKGLMFCNIHSFTTIHEETDMRSVTYTAKRDSLDV